MKTYTIYFEIYDKKMKTTVEALNENDAKAKVKKKINFIKVVENDPLDFLKNIFGI